MLTVACESARSQGVAGIYYPWGGGKAPEDVETANARVHEATFALPPRLAALLAAPLGATPRSRQHPWPRCLAWGGVVGAPDLLRCGAHGCGQRTIKNDFPGAVSVVIRPSDPNLVTVCARGRVHVRHMLLKQPQTLSNLCAQDETPLAVYSTSGALLVVASREKLRSYEMKYTKFAKPKKASEADKAAAHDKWLDEWNSKPLVTENVQFHHPSAGQPPFALLTATCGDKDLFLIVRRRTVEIFWYALRPRPPRPRPP